MQTIVYGDFSGPFSSREPRVQLPRSAFPEDLQHDALFDLRFLQGVAEFEAIVEAHHGPDASEARLTIPWSPDIVAVVNRRISDGSMELVPMMHAETIYRTATVAQVRGVLDAIRTRVLSLALELERTETTVGEPDADRLPAAVVTYTFNTIVMNGGTASVGTDPVVVQALARPTADLDDLLARLRAIGVSDDLVTALEADLANGPDEESAVRRWLSRLVAQGGQMGMSITTGVVTQLVLAHFGLA
jgi:hypothetical protein